MMQVLSVHSGADTAGVSWLLSQAFARLGGGVELRSAIRKRNYIQYPMDADWVDADELWDAADVVHMHNTMRTEQYFVGRGHKPKPVLLHHHGTQYRDNSAVVNAEVRRRNRVTGARAVVATLDLLEQGPGVPWCPAPFDLDWLAGLANPHEGVAGVDRPVRIGHAPTDRGVKSTNKFLAAAARLGKRVEVVLIERRPWEECLRVKATCDLYFDQVTLGYGHNAVEAWGMGIPVIAGASKFTTERMTERFDRLPFYEATEGTIHDALAALVDPVVRGQYAGFGSGHVRRWHDGRETVAQLVRLYEQLRE